MKPDQPGCFLNWVATFSSRKRICRHAALFSRSPLNVCVRAHAVGGGGGGLLSINTEMNKQEGINSLFLILQTPRHSPDAALICTMWGQQSGL